MSVNMEGKNKLEKSDKPEKKSEKKQWKGLRQTTGAIKFTIGAVVNKKRHYFGQKAVKSTANQ